VRGGHAGALRTGGGAIVCVSSRAAKRPFRGAPGYVTSKAAVLAFVGALDADLRDDGVRASAVLPSVIDTPADRRDQSDADHSRRAKPEAIARGLRFLSSDDSTPESGGCAPVCGRGWPGPSLAEGLRRKLGPRC
jgi:NAD(P)-dependent dehydrogenase (short-subunit alcohol dehydrogenase family)